MKSLREHIRKILNENFVIDNEEFSNEVSESIEESVKPVRKVAGALIKDEESGEVLLIKRNDKTPKWAMVTGEFDEGEDALDALEREMYEELFIRPGQVRLNYKGMEHFSAKNIDFYYFEGFVKGKFKPHLDEENLDFGWFSIENLPSPLMNGTYARVNDITKNEMKYSDTKQVSENLQLADKVYFNTKKLSPKVREVITTKITNGDIWTKLITDIYWATLQDNLRQSEWIMHVLDNPGTDMPKKKDEYKTENDVIRLEDWKQIKSYYQQLKAYNKNVFPIANLNPNGVEDIWSVIRALKQRATILEKIKSLPSAALRNMREDIRTPRDGEQMNTYRHRLEYFLGHYSLLDNRDAELKKFVEKKMFKSGMTIEKLLSFVEEKENLLGGKKFDKDVIKSVIEDNNHGELEIIYDQGDIMVVEVGGPYGIKEIGCNSLWCFTYGEGYSRDWSTYSYNDTVYVIIDFSEKSDSANFMNVVIRPLVWNPKDEHESEKNDETIFDMSNTNRYDALNYLDSVIGIDKAKELFTFYVEPEEEEEKEEGEEEDNYEEKEKEYKDPNQLSLFEARRQVRLIMEQRLMPKHYLKEAVNLLKEAEEKSPTYQWDFIKGDEKSPTYQWDLRDKESGVKDDVSPTYQWDLSQDNPTLDSYEKAKEYIDKAISYIKDKASAIDFVRDLKDYIDELSTSAKLKLTKYVATALLGIIGFGGMTSLLSNSTSEVEREVVKTIVANKNSKDKIASDSQNIKAYPTSSSEDLIGHLKASEGYNSTFYDLKDGAYTVGWGHAVFRDTSRGSTGGDYPFVPKFNQITPDVTMLLSAEDMKSLKGLNDSEKKQKMSELAELNADQLLRDDIKKAEEKLNAILTDWESQGIEVKIDQDMYDAMISMIFNMGAGEKFRTSDFLQSVKRGDLEGAYNAIDKIDNPKLLTKYPGLRDRREKEKAMFGSSLASVNQKNNTNDISEIRKIIKQIINEII